MTQIAGKDTKQELGADKDAPHGEASAQSHSGEGAASVMAQLILQDEKRPRHDEHPGDRAS